MKVLIIKEKTAYYLNPKTEKGNEDENKIENITKNDILDILDYMIDNDVEFDAYTKETLSNPIQDVMYKSLYENFESIKNSKEDIIKEIDNRFRDAEEKYKNNNDTH